MEILNEKETSELILLRRGNNTFDTPIRRAFENLAVGESLVLNQKEFNKYYKGTVPGVFYGWAHHFGWKVNAKKIKKEKMGVDDTEIIFAIIRRT